MRYSTISFAVLAALACSAANAEVINGLQWNVTGEYQLPTPEALKDGVQAYVASGKTETLTGSTGSSLSMQGRWANAFLAEQKDQNVGKLNVQGIDSIDLQLTNDQKIYTNVHDYGSTAPHISGQRGVNVIHATGRSHGASSQKVAES
ncbi:hypothetical protein [uncultured Sutterella sp.]|mgnify:CR=1 FL=1|uniref:hypothetical protein n=1 Tax=uncultured Sutterella sp. TaxID=286133 RepID=UPI00261BBF94|nr:hypothetical protein [uncultured Sutterella sp.]